MLLVVLICGAAFLLALTSARNSDLWLHLASGRWLAEHGGLPNGADPFSSSTQGVFWVNHNWLADLLLYEMYKVGNGPALVFGKAVLAATLAALWFCFRRRSEGMATLTLAGYLAVLALGPWLALQPALLSLLGVVLTLYLLERSNLIEGERAEGPTKGLWLLVPLFALWANLDGWFVLGPIMVGLYALGRLFGRRPVLLLFLVFCAGLAACLATPYHYRVFTWPTPLGLTQAEQALRHDPLGANLIVSPFESRFAASALFRSPGAWAYYVLLAASGVSFVLSIRKLHPGRLLVWLGLAALSSYQMRAIPFFAAAAAPILALNVHDWARDRVVSETLHRLHIVVLQLEMLAGIALLWLAWPGWLQPAPYQPRGWTIEPDGSIQRMAEQLKRWRENGHLQPERFTLTFSRDTANYLAWYCPEEKGFLDSRLPLFDRVADDFVRMRHCLLQENAPGADKELASFLDAHRIDRILLYDSDWDRMTRAYRNLFRAKAEWELLAVEGGATLFRRSKGTPSPDAFDYRRAAYHPAPDERAPMTPRPPRPPRWFEVFVPRAERRSPDREAAALHLLSFDLEVDRLALQWVSMQRVGLIGCGAGREPAAVGAALALGYAFPSPLPAAGPEPLYLAVRAARRAMAENPDDGGAYLLLGEAYVRLSSRTSERDWQVMLPLLAELRQAQIVTALEQAVLLRPDLDRAHDLLGEMYLGQRQMDRCLDHRRARLRIAQQALQEGGPAAAAAAERLPALQVAVEEVEKAVSEAEKMYQANAADKAEPSKVLLRAQLAVRYGQYRKALEMLQESSPAIFGRPGVEYQLDLMMRAGQSYEVLDGLDPDYEHKINFDIYHWVKCRAAASCGDYQEADEELGKDCQPLRGRPLSPTLFLPVRSEMAFLVGEAVLSRSRQVKGDFRRSLLGMAGPPRREADLQVLRGLLAVEAGRIEKARQRFRAALDVWGSEKAAAEGGGLDFPARPIAQEMLRRLSEPRR